MLPLALRKGHSAASASIPCEDVVCPALLSVYNYMRYVRGGGGGVYTVSEWFNPLEPPRIFSNHFSAEKARCVEVFDVSSEWFDCLLEPHLHSGNKMCRVPVHCFRVVQPPRTSSNLLEPLQCRESKVCRSL